MTNVGTADRVVRFLLGAVLLLAPFLAAETFAGFGAWRFVIAALGVVLLATAAFRICPAYMVFGVRTCAMPRG